ncbi:MAG: glycosyltransferase [Acidobacteria bacterium]|nr:glycosyltransferase [Acidobacteriota bacterium]
MVSTLSAAPTGEDSRHPGKIYCFVPRMDRSGAPMSAFLLLRSLRQSHSVGVLSLTTGALTPTYKKAGISIVHLGPTDWYRLRWRRLLRSLLDPRILRGLHINNLCKEGVALARTAHRIGIPVLWHVREDPHSTRARKLRRTILRLSKRIVTVSDEIRQNLFPGEPPDRVTTVHNGVELRPWNQTALIGPLRSTLGWNSSCTVVGLLGRLVPRKGLSEFLQAARALSLENKTVRYLIMGQWNQRSQTERAFTREMKSLLRDLELSTTAFCTGEVDDPLAALKECDIVALPSWWEGSSRTLLEAMALGRPVVATSAGGNPEIVEDGVSGFLVPPRDPGALLEALRTLVAEPELCSRFGRAGRERIEESFSLETHCVRMKSQYEGTFS